MSAMRTLLAAAVVAGGLTPIVLARAQAADAAPAAPSASASASMKPGEEDLASVTNYSVPDAPALTHIGATTTIDRPSSPSKFALALVNLVTPSGALRSGAAMEVSLRGLGIYEPRDWNTYRHDFWARFATRIALSVATSSDSATTATQSGTTVAVPSAARIGFGLRLVFWDETDPLLDPAYKAAVDATRAKCPDPTAFDCRQKVYNDYSDWKPIKWNAGGFALAAAYSDVFAESKVKNGKSESLSTWATLAFGAGSFLHVSVSALYRRHFIEDRNAVGGAGRLRLGGETVRALAEGSYVNVGLPEAAGRRGRAGVGAEVRISSTTWLSATLGGDFEGASSPMSVFVLSNLKYAFVDKPSLW